MSDHAGGGSRYSPLQHQLIIERNLNNADVFAIENDGQGIDQAGMRAVAMLNVHIQVVGDPDIQHAAEIQDAFYLTADLDFVIKPQAGAQRFGIATADTVEFLLIGLSLLLIIPQQNGTGNQKRHGK